MNPKSASRMDRFAQFAVACSGMALSHSSVEYRIKMPTGLGSLWGQPLVVYHSQSNSMRFSRKRVEASRSVIGNRTFPGGSN